ncbi:uncharacterized protein LOC113360136 [Papaver somniferum]|uniref:uncharacterized protein LOC113360136 n=1 Tax=Papaver somniferum TaxID=3469 RepID=UPI000E6F696B|nr:uncharacterized protein LOC113360136 [Papaver somniferum]
MEEPYDSSHMKMLTFAEMVVGKKFFRTTIDLKTLPKPTVEEGKPALVIPDALFRKGCEIWQYSLIGRLDFKDINFGDVKKSLEEQWMLGVGKVKFVPMSKGFFIIKLSSLEDKMKVNRKEPWFFQQQVLKLQEWFPSFDPTKQKTSHATVWAKFPGLPVELWTEESLLAIAQTLGTPIVVDSKTLNHDYGYFASVLIDINFVESVATEIILTSGGRKFPQVVENPKKPSYCKHCSIIGHAYEDCKNARKVFNKDPKKQSNTQVNIGQHGKKRNQEQQAKELNKQQQQKGVAGTSSNREDTTANEKQNGSIILPAPHANHAIVVNRLESTGANVVNLLWVLVR